VEWQQRGWECLACEKDEGTDCEDEDSDIDE